MKAKRVTRKHVNEAIGKLRKGIMTTNEHINNIMDKAVEISEKEPIPFSTVKELKDAVYYYYN